MEPSAPVMKGQEINLLLSQDKFDQSLWKSLRQQIHERMHPEKLPPLHLTSRPVHVKNIWGDYDYKKRGVLGSTTVHIFAVAAIIWFSIYGNRLTSAVKPKDHVELIAPDVSVYMPMPAKAIQAPSGGGGGGGDRDKLQAPKGKLPKQSMEQFTPPQMVIRNPNPKLPMEPTVVIPPTVQLANNNLPNLGDPKSVIPSGPPSNGIGSGGGIGSGSGGGVGSGSGPGVGPGSGGGTGGGVFRVGGGVSAPRALFTPDPEYSEEARRAKYQGTVVLWLIVGPDGRPNQVKVARTLGMGLDQKAIEAVRNWRFDPAKLNGSPVAVQINVEVNFRLY
ncbi:MAG TPA: energy transducer TonB [Terriglobales bacterium]|nr:energy transducer TonB [Terriglobales bacterium]